MDAIHGVTKHQPVKEVLDIGNNVSSSSKSLVHHSKIRPPTPCASFKRPTLTAPAQELASKRLRLDMPSSMGLGAPKLEKSKSKSVVNLSNGHLKSKMAQRTEVTQQHHSGTLQKAPSLNCISSVKTSKISAPTTKAGKRPAWDLKGRMQDYDDALKEIQIQNADLMKTTEVYNQRLAMLESNNCKLLEEVRTKDTISLEKSNKLEELQGQLQEKNNDYAKMEKKNSTLQREVKKLKLDVSTTQQVNTNLQETIDAMTSTEVCLRTQLTRLQVDFDNLTIVKKELEAAVVSLKNDISALQSSLVERDEKIRLHEDLRRKLHNTIQDLKGNIRVFCRVRPALPSENCKLATIAYTDDRHSMEITKPTASDEGSKCRGNTNTKCTFIFDRVFDTNADQATVFEEVSQLVQSALDGYNVCIFAYGQTGSGKTFTMEGPGNANSNQRGMIPRTVEQIFESVKTLESQGWQYSMEATYVEIYNEAIRDLLCNQQDSKVKHEIKMCDTKGNEIYISNLCSVNISSKEQVSQLLLRAQRNRAVAATQCNERSSRSHSIFRLHISGKNFETSVACQGMLNLVDLAGSERLKESHSEGDRLKETKSINKSLSNLSNVITSLANKSEHIPYRNSKLTHLLMNSLGGNSKTLMIVNVSPCDENVNETINSLRFAATVNQCEIGTAKKRAVK